MSNLVRYSITLTSNLLFIADEELWTKNENDQIFRYVCNVCSWRCMNLGDMRRHARVHTGERPYVCDDCGRSFKVKQHLKKHYATVHMKDFR